MRFIVVGCGRMGMGLAHVLGLRGHAVTVLDRDPIAVERLGSSFRGDAVIGSGFDRGALRRAGIEHADGLAVVTNNDEVNVVLARLAGLAFHVPRVVARLVDPRKAEVYHRLGVQTVAPISWAIHRLADLLSYSELDAVLGLGGGEVEIVQVEVPPLLTGHKVSAVSVPGEIRVVAVSRRGKAFIPLSETVFEKDDSLHIAVLTTSVERLRSMLSSD
ncbi:MAG: TrkA family potassium uptake protein [Syntrophobacteraceae bacterium]|jgi:trk system potassium uptake protein TrkA|nr:TrkA family potassium uptake protein [Syntrophobacteraceae bacterium]